MSHINNLTCDKASSSTIYSLLVDFMHLSPFTTVLFAFMDFNRRKTKPPEPSLCKFYSNGVIGVCVVPKFLQAAKSN